VAKVKDMEPNLDSESDRKNMKNRKIGNEKLTSTVVNKTIQLEELVDIEEGVPLPFTDVGEGDPIAFHYR
jgi:hypothetical protein